MRRKFLVPIVVVGARPRRPGDADAQVGAGPCVPVIAVACGLAGDAIGVVGDVVGGAAGDVVGAGASIVGNSVLDGVSSWVGQGAAWLIERIGRQVERSTRPELGATWFTKQYRGMLSLALVLSLAFLLGALMHAALRQDLAAALRASFVALPVAVISCFAAVTLVELLLAATDDATRLLTRQTGDDSRAFFDDLATSIVPSGASPLPGFLAMLGALLAALLCIVVWIELILREAAVYLAVAFLPLSLAAMVWQRTAHLARRLVEGLVGVILAKLAIAVAVAFAASALGNGGEGAGGLSTMLAGCAVLFLAALSPWMLLRLIPLAGDAAPPPRVGQAGDALGARRGHRRDGRAHRHVLRVRAARGAGRRSLRPGHGSVTAGDLEPDPARPRHGVRTVEHLSDPTAAGWSEP